MRVAAERGTPRANEWLNRLEITASTPTWRICIRKRCPDLIILNMVSYARDFVVIELQRASCALSGRGGHFGVVRVVLLCKIKSSFPMAARLATCYLVLIQISEPSNEFSSLSFSGDPGDRWKCLRIVVQSQMNPCCVRVRASKLSSSTEPMAHPRQAPSECEQISQPMYGWGMAEHGVQRYERGLQNNMQHPNHPYLE